MDLPTIRRYFDVAEELYAAGHRLHAFATLHALFAVPTTIQLYYRREEILCRVRAAEMLLYNSSPPQQGKNSTGSGSSAPSATVARLDLAYSVLSPMISSRWYLEGVIVCPLLWDDGSSDGARAADGERKGEKAGEDGEGRFVPVALIVKAYVLSAIVHRRRLRHTQAVKCIEAAGQWCSTAFCASLTGLATSLPNDAEAEAQQREEKRCCEAFLSVEFCRVYYSQLVSAGTAVVAENRTPNTAVLHAARTHALDRLLYHAKEYASYVTSDGLEPLLLEDKRRRQCSSLCFSSPKNLFSIRAAARVLSHYYCAALILDHRLVEAERQMQRCGVLFGFSPEMLCMMQLLAVGLRGPLAWKGPRGVKRQRSEQVPDESQVAQNEGSMSPKEGLRWMQDGLLVALRCYLTMHAASMDCATAETTVSFNSVSERIPVDANTVAVNNTQSGNNPVRLLFQRTLRCIDEQLTLLTTEVSQNGCEVNNARKDLLYSSPSADIRFLVLLKCAALVTMTTYALSQLWLVEAVRHLHQLRRYMNVFHKHTTSVRVHYHLMVSQLTSMLSLRHLSGKSNVANYTETREPKRLSEREEEERTAGFDVGLPYAHVLAAERATLSAASVCLCGPSTRLLVSLMKGAAISHAARVGSAIHITDAGVTLTHLTVHQRHRCAMALTKVLEVLKASFVAVSAQEEEEEKRKEDDESSLRQIRSAWNKSNQVFFLLLCGAAAMSEEKDELTAISMFKNALKQVRRYFGPTSGVASEPLYLLAMAYNESERMELHPSEASTPVSEGGNEYLLAIANGATDSAQQTFSVAWQVASKARRLAQLHCVLALQESDSKENHRHIVGEWNMEVHRVCLLMRRELMEVVSF
ncbi:hypothetical protein TcYC6_0113300 [Trypanosoma cruzi]|uniref:Uncharacterized protein n=1 Tax=Trypanosoma cruzi TaxID=5693 RepID=A0A7J6YAI0_TRYCR|nr:hypothetical protein ECC02_003215 [Trypanosoma cruzi]KAF8292553.1 hypothetical protein TcYC6_0113300 [Trypanosoma cruzi]